MTAIDPATCWVPVPVRWRYVQPGDVTVGVGGDLIPIEMLDYSKPGQITVTALDLPEPIPVDPDELVSILVPVPERDAQRLTVEQLGGVVTGRRTVKEAS
jgi:hypothetical protein